MIDNAPTGEPSSSDKSVDVRPGAVLFACRINVIRSPIAAALTRQLFPNQIYTRSAGVRPGDPDPFVRNVMDEIGVDISRHVPRSFEELEDTNFDLIITLAPEAHHKALELTRTHAIDVEYWPTLDPSLATGSRSQILDAYRGLRDELTLRIKKRFAWQPRSGD